MRDPTADSVGEGSTGAGPARMPRVRVDLERDAPRGWEFDLVIQRSAAAPETAHTLTMAWVDYELWCGGSSPPSRVAEAVARFALDRLGDGRSPAVLPGRFDAATVRRWAPMIDEELPGLL